MWLPVSGSSELESSSPISGHNSQSMAVALIKPYLTGVFGLKRLIKLSVGSLLTCLFLVPGSVGECQTRQLPKAGFQRFSGNLPSVSGSGMNSAGVPSSISSMPGLHLSRGENRTRQNASDPYNPGEPTLNMALVRWQRSKMPIRIWISPGLKLPEAPFETLPSTRPETVMEMLKGNQPFSTLPIADGWTQETNYQVASGIEQWRQFEQEGLLSFGFVQNPKDAQVLVFFLESFKGAGGPGGLNVGGLTCAKVFTLSDARILKSQNVQWPVIIELPTGYNHTPEKMAASAAHEFGHALGIKAHSPFREDIMFADRVVTTLSEGDKNTLRLLYRAQPKYVM